MASAPSPPEASSQEPLPAWVQKWFSGYGPVVLLGLYLLAVFAQVHFGTDGLYERDGYYHARLSHLFLERGLSREFPWTQASVWKDRFCDKEFLFHLLMAPFTRDPEEPVRGAQVFISLVGLGLFGAVYGVLRRHGARWPLLFAALLACSGADFLVRLTMIRSHVLSMLLAVLAVHLLLSSRWKALALLGFVYAWSYTFPLVLVMIAAPFVLGRWLGGGGLDWRLPLASLLGVAVGTVVHPFSPLTLDTFVSILKILGSAWEGGALPLGNEIHPRTTRWFLLEYPLLALSLSALLLGGWRTGRRLTPEASGVLTTALFWIGGMMLFPRFAEYAVPLTVIALGLVVRDALAGVDLRRQLLAPFPRAVGWLIAGCALGLAGLHAYSVHGLYRWTATASPPRFRAAAAWMAENLAPGETVVNLAWGDFPDLFYDAHRQRFLWGIDPVFTARLDSEPSRILLEAARDGGRIDPKELARVFGARYLAVANYRGAIGGGPWKPVYSDPYVSIYSLLDAPWAARSRQQRDQQTGAQGGERPRGDERGAAPRPVPDHPEQHAGGEGPQPRERVIQAERPALRLHRGEVGQERLLGSFRQGMVQAVEADHPEGDEDRGGEGQAGVAERVQRPTGDDHRGAADPIGQSTRGEGHRRLDHVEQKPGERKELARRSLLG